MIKTLIVLLISIVFSGCISLTQNIPSQKVYSLNLKEHNVKRINASIEIKEAKAISSLNSTNLLYTRSNSKEFYAFAKWSDKPSKMIQNIIIESLSSSFNLVRPRNIRFATKYTLDAYLLAFEQNISNDKSLSKFTINIYLKNNYNSNIYFKQFTYTKDNEKIDSINAVNDLNNLSNRFIKDLNLWLEERTK